MEKFVEKHQKLFQFLLIIGIVCVIAPIILGCGYTYLCEDDFSFEGGAQDLVRDYGSSLVGAAVRTGEYYNTNQGTFLFTYIISFLRAYSRWGLTGFHAVMILNAGLFMFFLYKLIKAVAADKVAACALFLAASTMIFAMSNTYNDIELFYWYTGGMNFVLEYWLSFAAALCLILFIKIEKGFMKWTLLVLGCITGFLASGGALNLTMFNCVVLFATLLFSINLKEKKNLPALLPFVFAAIGAIINGVAPGNFVRSDDGLKEGHSTLVDGLRDTFSCCIAEDKVLFTSKVFLLMLGLVFVVCFIRNVKIKKSGMTHIWLLISFIGTCVARFAILFPICFGYHEGEMVNMRTTSAYEIAAKLMYILFVACLAQWAKEHYEKIAGYVSYAALAACVVLTVVGYAGVKSELKDGLSYMTYWDIRSGDMKKAYDTREYVLSSMALAPEGSDLVITVPLHSAPSMYGMGLMDDPGEFRNISAAGLFRLNSVSVNYTD